MVPLSNIFTHTQVKHLNDAGVKFLSDEFDPHSLLEAQGIGQKTVEQLVAAQQLFCQVLPSILIRSSENTKSPARGSACVQFVEEAYKRLLKDREAYFQGNIA